MNNIKHLPQLSGELFLTDGGLETTLIFHQDFELPEFAAFELLQSERGYSAMLDYFQRYMELARQYNAGMILESPTWRASLDWGAKLGRSADFLQQANQQAIKLLTDVRDAYPSMRDKVAISGCIGSRGNGYAVEALMSAAEAQRYHRVQIETLRDAGADLVSAFTMTYTDEALGIVQAAQAADIPVVISFTVETDGELPSGEGLQDAIQRLDDLTGAAPAYYMINCAHPSHFMDVLVDHDSAWLSRIHGIRANASCMSHAELDAATELDDGDPLELATLYAQLLQRLPELNILGGCCGTDERHIDAAGKAVQAYFSARP